jgi:hypothetical protein
MWKKEHSAGQIHSKKRNNRKKKLYQGRDQNQIPKRFIRQPYGFGESDFSI